MNYFNINKKFVLYILVTLFLLPGIVLAQFPLMPSLIVGVDLFFLIATVSLMILNVVWMVAITFVIIMFVLAGFKFLTAQGDPGKVAEANKAVIWGIGGIIVIILAFSILVVMRVTLGI